IEQLFNDAYEPMLAALERHEGIRIGLHNSGPLFDWIMANRPDYMERLRGLCERGQVEMLTGGYYEPVLPMIPDGDKAGQIRKLTGFIEEKFGQTPTGLWLTERVWEPGLPVPLAHAGVRWTLVDDAHFRMVGLPADALDGYYITEDQGERINLFSGSQRLRYTIPWLNVEDLIAELRHRADTNTREAPYIVLGDDGEKFGGWPTTRKHVWDEGWIERFFAAVEAEQDWLEMVTPGEYMRRHEARGLVYLPTASYAEMMEWAMPAQSSAEYHRVAAQLHESGREDVLQYVRGGFWRYFLAKYPEANAMHKRGLRIDRKLEQTDNASARDALWRAQCNCPYWHGVFGGLYLRNIRAATHANLVQAERLADEAAGHSGVRIEADDFDYDGQRELLMQSSDVSLMLHPEQGGMLSEFDLRRRDHAFIDVITRRREAYHEALLSGTAGQSTGDLTNIHGGVRLKHEGLAEDLAFDRHRRGGLQEWVLPSDEGIERFARSEAHALFEPDGAWSCETDCGEGGASVVMARASNGWSIEKRVEMPARGEQIAVTYKCVNVSNEHRSGRFVSEWNVSAPQAADGDDRIARLETDERSIDLHNERGVVRTDAIVVRGSAPWGMRCEIEGDVDVWHFPVHTVSSSEGGLERVAQGASVSFVRALDLAPGASMSMRLAWSVVE
ncbi:MAG: alpha-amylase/4-alpha-glucanotransferase domain-containing protein, partial [Dehalococcoidia bacterium]